MNPFRIAMIAACPLPAPRGTPIRIHRIAEELTRRGHHVDVLTYNLDIQPPPAAYTAVRTSPLVACRNGSPGPSLRKLLLLDPLLAVKLRRMVAARRYDVIHAHHVEGLLVALSARRRARIPIVFDAHTLLESELPYYPLGLPRRMLGWLGGQLDTRLPRLADHVIAVSDPIRIAFTRRAGLAEERVSVIPNGVEDEFFDRPGAIDRQESSPVSRVVFAGNMAAYQGLDLLLQAFSRALCRQPDLRLQILSDGSFSSYEDAARRLGIRDRVDVRPVALENLPGELSDLAVAVNPRIACDGVPQKLLNYMAAACPIVSFSGSARHLVHGTSAWVVADGDIDGFADGIVRLARDRPLASMLGRNARDYAHTHLSWGHAASQIEQVYAGLLERHR